MHIYAFGSVCRGEIDRGSDIDLLALVATGDARFDPLKFSVYSYDRMCALWREGSPFAWHLFHEARILYSEDTQDVLRKSEPAEYKRALTDCVKFREIFADSAAGLRAGTGSPVFELATVFLAVRNLAICFSLGYRDRPVFSRDAALRLGDQSLVLERGLYATLSAARVLSTRGIGRCPSHSEVDAVAANLGNILSWMDSLISIARSA
jgi:Nucleotidyltransferase domain